MEVRKIDILERRQWSIARYGHKSQSSPESGPSFLSALKIFVTSTMREALVYEKGGTE